ncbi:HD domain-containing protein [Tenacibaculum sp. C7A-26P2]|uniref:HD domain-containing protein n=1 Tax=Tenacibaculum sp. C7A-26P2 TaxID=3447504 RepID=UPI003F875172
MDENIIIENTKLFVKKTLIGAESGHDFFHAERVYKNSLTIAKKENVNEFIVGLGALLHDIADSKFYEGDETIGPKKARLFMEDQHVDKPVIDHVVKIIENISFKGGNFVQNFKSSELDVIQDADRLDAIGAIGIARCFNYGGYKNRELYNPDISPKLEMNKEEYKKSEAPTINHFYEKLLLLKDRMNTKTGKEMALKRHQYMEGFLKQFYKEWSGEFC